MAQFFFGGGGFEHTKENAYFNFLYNFIFSETFPTLRRTEQDIVINTHKYSLFLLDFSQTVIFSADFRKIIKFKIS
jgi:hypothetical protein